MTEFEYNYLQKALSEKLEKVKMDRGFRFNTKYFDGYKDALLAAKSILSQEYKHRLSDVKEKQP